jgi:hypothetical protein
MSNAWLHRFAILLAIGALLLIVDGALAGRTSLHPILGIPVALLALIPAVWLTTLPNAPAQVRWLGWITVALAAATPGLRLYAVFSGSESKLVGISHALLGPLFFAATVATALVTSPAWARGPEPVNDYGWPSNRSLAVVSPFLVLMQIALGAAFRQKAMGLMPHVLGAMFVALVILLQCIFVLQQFKTHRALQAAGKTLLGVAFGQVFLGMTALIMRSMAEETARPVVITVASHITGGAITLAATLVLSILVRRSVQPRPQEEGEESEEPAATG